MFSVFPLFLGYMSQIFKFTVIAKFWNWVAFFFLDVRRETLDGLKMIKALDRGATYSRRFKNILRG